MHSGVGGTGMMGSSQPFLPFGGNRPPFPTANNASQERFDSSLFTKSLDNLGGLPMNRPPGSAPSNSLQNSQGPETRFSSPRLGAGDGLGMPFRPGFPSMFRHHAPPGSGFPPPPNFSTPPPEHNMPGNQSTNPGMGHRPMGDLNLPFQGSGFHGNSFSHAPGTERPQSGRESGQQPQTPPQMNFPVSCNLFT